MTRARSPIISSTTTTLAFGLALTLVGGGCGGGSESEQQRAQKSVAAFERRIGKLNSATAGTATRATSGAVSALESAIRRYGALPAPPVVEPGQRRIVSGLRRELRAVRRGIEGTSRGDRLAISAASKQILAAQREVGEAIDETLRITSLCRVKLSACTPAAGSASSDTGE